MSTKIYDAIKVEDASLKQVIDLAKNIKEMELENMRDNYAMSLAAHWLKTEDSKLIDFINDTDHFKWRLYDAAKKFIKREMSNPSAAVLPENCKLFAEDVKAGNIDLTDYDISVVISLLSYLCYEKSITVHAGNNGSALIKGFNLSAETMDALYKKYPDYHYQNQVDPLELEYTAPFLETALDNIRKENDESTQFDKSQLQECYDAAIAAAKAEYPANVWFDHKGNPIAKISSEQLEKAVNNAHTEFTDGLDNYIKWEDIKTREDFIDRYISDIRFAVFRLRDEEWDSALGDTFMFNESGLYFDVFSGVNNERHRVAAQIIKKAVELYEENGEEVQNLRKKKNSHIMFADMYMDYVTETVAESDVKE